VFVSARVAVFVDGCFWHGCPEHGSLPRRNADYWGQKIAKNKLRDARNDEALAAAGWRVVRCWEHENVDTSAHRVIEAMRSEPEARQRVVLARLEQ
jgi:DNA mismatch endonuclease (patch repair protein)